MRTKELPEDYAVVLQQIDRDGIDDCQDLAERLRLETGRVTHIVRSLHHKGLIKIVKSAQWNCWVAPSSKGKRFAELRWPEARALHRRYQLNQ